jgi:hypothetical protein
MLWRRGPIMMPASVGRDESEQDRSHLRSQNLEGLLNEWPRIFEEPRCGHGRQWKRRRSMAGV